MKVGIQLYSVRQSMAKDPMGTIRKVAETGYRNLEVANHFADTDAGVGFGVSVEELKGLLSETGASVVSAHISPLVPEKMGPILEYHKAIGTKYIGIAIGFFRDRADVLEQAALFNRLGGQCKEAGIQLVYHNHFQEFQVFEGETVLDTLMNNTDPEHLKIELDTYWVMRSGQSPVDVLKKYGKRVCLVHQKDFTKGYESEIDLLAPAVAEGVYIDMERFVRDIREETFTEIGTGIMDIQSIIDTAKEHCACEYIILEQDYSTYDELESIKISMDSFKKFEGIEW